MTRRVRLEIPNDGNILRQESELRSLRKALDEVDGATIEWVDSATNQTVDGKNAPALADAALWLGISGSAVKLAAIAIREWAAIQRSRRVRLTDGDKKLEIDGKLDATTAQALEHFLGRDEA
ncbi:hypothetical protein [Nonomuraea sp. NPDC048916]|uniref:hypothetical protein n=1 Tax=Nonomuraea sp. NPDC048916 TaxID=3154232 RepID=UPI0033DDDD32